MPATIRTESGQVSGSGNDVISFKGIPFAAPPVGELRWKPPQKPASWSGVRECNAFGDDPVQMPDIELRGPKIGEDCLSLNVWTPLPGAGKLPVMVWIYGGGFVLGSSSLPMYDGEALARKGAVVVSINYRLGIFGFMAHPALTAESPNHASGNYGFLDQVAALKWVRENIAGFGGDPNNVTIFGESAGGVSVASHLLSPLSKGLFHRAILQSPANLRVNYTLANAEKAAVAVLGDDLAALRAMPVQELLPKTFQIGGPPGALTAPQPIRMITDGWAFPEDERAALLAGHFAKVPMLIGGVEHEGAFFLARMPIKTLADYQGFAQGRLRQIRRGSAPALSRRQRRGGRRGGVSILRRIRCSITAFAAWHGSMREAARRPIAICSRAGAATRRPRPAMSRKCRMSSVISTASSSAAIRRPTPPTNRCPRG